MNLTHGYVLYVVALYTEDVIYSRQRNFKLSSNLRVVYCQFCKARLGHTKGESLETIYMWPFTPASLYL